MLSSALKGHLNTYFDASLSATVLYAQTGPAHADADHLWSLVIANAKPEDVSSNLIYV